ncbi:MAG: DNA polymerase III subunit delta [bacterium]|nr:DNA polymerase III subunit delta [bacterium]
MTFLLYGEDSFRARLKLREMTDQYKKVRRSGLDLFSFDFHEGDNPEDSIYKLRTIPMFSKRRLFIFENALSDEQTSKPLLDFLKNYGSDHGSDYKNEDTLVFFETALFPADNPLFLFLKKNATVHEFKPLSALLTVQWLKKEVNQLGGKISDEAARALVAGLGTDLWVLSNEIKKLVCLKEGKIIDAADIKFTNQLAANIFHTIEAMASGDKRLALKLFSRHLEGGESLFYLLSMVAYQFRTLIIIASLLKQGIKQMDIPHLAGLNSFAVSKCLPLLKRTSLDNLKTIYAKIVDTDFKIKTGQLLPRQGLETLVLNL